MGMHTCDSGEDLPTQSGISWWYSQGTAPLLTSHRLPPPIASPDNGNITSLALADGYSVIVGLYYSAFGVYCVDAR